MRIPYSGFLADLPQHDLFRGLVRLDRARYWGWEKTKRRSSRVM